jgi:hypothetical protein
MAYQLMRIMSQPGVQRDGTVTAAQAYTDAQWCRWQRGLPRKMGGYKNTQAYLTAVSRALFSQAQSGYRYIYSGTATDVDFFTIDNTGVASGVINPAIPTTTNPTTTGLPTAYQGTYPPSQTNSWQFDTQFDNASNLNLLFGVCAQNLQDPANGGVGSSSSSVGYPLYCTSVYSPQAWTQGVITAGSTITPTAQTGFVQVQGYGTGSDGFGGTQQALFPNGITGGVVSLAPYLFVYGNNGFVAWSSPGFPTDFTGVSQGDLYVGATQITNQKIVRGIPLRGGGGYSPNGLFWSIDSLVRATFIGIPNGTFQFDQITTQSSILSDRSIIEDSGTFYWAGVDRFLMYNGVIQEIPNSMNLNWFFDSINPIYAAKSFAMKIPRYGEIWWCYPRGTATECSHAVIYNYREKTWYDTILPPDLRCSGLHADNFVGNIMGSPTPYNQQTAQVLTSVGNASSGHATYTGTWNGNFALAANANALVGQSVTIAGFVTEPAQNNGTFVIVSSNSTQLVVTNGSAIAESHAATATLLPAANYNLWQHEQGTDQIFGTNVSAVLSSFTTAPITGFDSTPPSDEGITLGVMQPDFVQSGNITVNVLKQNNAAEPVYAGSQAIIQVAPLNNTGVQAQQIGYTVPLKDTAKIIRLQFISNVVGGNYQMGRTMIEVGTDGERDT